MYTFLTCPIRATCYSFRTRYDNCNSVSGVRRNSKSCGRRSTQADGQIWPSDCVFILCSSWEECVEVAEVITQKRKWKCFEIMRSFNELFFILLSPAARLYFISRLLAESWARNTKWVIKVPQKLRVWNTSLVWWHVTTSLLSFRELQTRRSRLVWFCKLTQIFYGMTEVCRSGTSGFTVRNPPRTSPFISDLHHRSPSPPASAYPHPPRRPRRQNILKWSWN